MKDPKTVLQESDEVKRITERLPGYTTDDNDTYFIQYHEVEGNDRQQLQHGSFILFGDDSYPDEDYTYIYVVNKSDILEELDKMNINEKELVPELEHKCHYIRQQYE